MSNSAPLVLLFAFALSYHIRSLRERGRRFNQVSVCRCYRQVSVCRCYRQVSVCRAALQLAAGSSCRRARHARFFK
ncbi:hypothetical protein [Methanimicrococcus stummii]|uniref:hypothetical protein n=1 Tax=Methanimicrococcus stummii TaxID=3028294 RepID=UPI00292E8A2B|nr:hypothetical protein [Methanimicrococcus sp. Es2]